ncbi:MAG: HAMP domain-containing histidine kinase [Spirochaetaceae bacterium]|nr:HAMP domain-containing histidine kinase [Spirochaetaceae bacterium]
MRLRTQLILLSIGIMVLPLVFLAAWMLPGTASGEGAPFLAAAKAQRYLAGLEGATASLPAFTAKARDSGGLAAAGFGPGGETVFSVGKDGPANPLFSPEPPAPGREAPEGAALLLSRRFEIQGYGPVRVYAHVQHLGDGDIGLDPTLVLPFVLLVFAAGLSVLIARSLRRSLDRLAGVAGRLASGEFETPVPATGREDVARLEAALEELRLALLDGRNRRARLIMGVSHDFRTPIALIRGYAEALEDGVAPDRGTEARYLGVIKDKTAELEALVDDLLGYVRMETDQRRGDLPTVKLRDFFRALAAEFAEDASMGGRSFSFIDRADGEPAAPLEGNAAKRAFRNLFGNAMRYTERGGSVVLELEGGAGGFSASIIDDGIGIDPKDLSAVFDPFFRGRNVGTRLGSGLGLAVVKSAIDAHGWRIHCVSEPGLGTRFTVMIPCG